MNRKSITQMMLIVIVLTACNLQGQAPTATSAPATDTVAAQVSNATATNTVAAAEASATSTTAPEVTATAIATRPPNAPDCTNSASFVADVTVPDNTEIEGGATFTKTWRIMNTGTCIWASDYTLTHYSDESMNAPASTPLPVTFPGQTADISVELIAPNSIGVHRANFVIKNAAGLIMKVNEDSRLWLIINVKTTVAATAAPTSPVAAPTPTTASSSGGSGTTTCGYALDQSKIIEVLNAVNAYRAQSSMSAYPVNPKLAQAAQTHATDMACNQVTSHTGSDGSNVAQRVAKTEYVAAYVDENVRIATPPVSGQDVVNLWVNDTVDTHSKLNLVSDTYIEIGIGYAFLNNTGYYVIVFASP